MSNKRKVVFLVLIFVAAIGLGVIGYKLTSDYMNKSKNKELKEEVFKPTEPVVTTTVEESAITEETTEVVEIKEPYVSPIDFDELWTINKDIYAWLDIPNTEISYPVLQREDDFQYYLRRGLDELYSNDGSLFTEPCDSKDMTDFITIIYGHNLRSLGMFGTLKYYRDLDYLNEHRDITIYIPTGAFHYKVFAAVSYSDELITAKFDFDTLEGKQAFLDSLDDIRDMESYILDDVEVTTEDNILVLSTCSANKTQRLLVVAVLTDVEQ